MTKQTMWLCAQRRLRPAWASAQSDQSLRCPHEESLRPQLLIEHTAKTDQTGSDAQVVWAHTLEIFAVKRIPGNFLEIEVYL